MQKRVIIVHGWYSSPDKEWFPYIKKGLEHKGFKVIIPSMPNSDEPIIGKWVSKLSKITGEVDSNTYFIGHSIGVQTILRYLENLPAYKKIGGAVFVAGWFTLSNLEKEEKEIAKPWLETSIDHKKVLGHTQNTIAIFSDNDPFVPKENIELFKKNFGAKIKIEHNKGHFSGEDSVTRLPIALESLLEIS